MTTRMTFALVLATACGGKATAPATVGNVGDDADPAGAFRTAVTQLAADRAGALRSWGTAELDEHAGPDYFAVIVEPERVDYVVEAGGARLVITTDLDGKTSPWLADEGASPPPWQDRGESRITHQQAHAGGFSRVELALRGGRVVVLRRVELDDAREGDEAQTQDFAGADDACAAGCPEPRAQELWYVLGVEPLPR